MGLVPIGKHLGVYRDTLVFDPPLKTAIVNFLIDKAPLMSDLYYFYCFDPLHSTYRVTNFSAYCPGAPRGGGFPLCVELLLEVGAPVDGESCVTRARSELSAFGVLSEQTKILFTSVKILEKGFPLPSLTNMMSLDVIRNDMKALELRNLTMLSVLSEKGLFFQTDVVADVFRKVMARQYA